MYTTDFFYHFHMNFDLKNGQAVSEKISENGGWMHHRLLVNNE